MKKLLITLLMCLLFCVAAAAEGALKAGGFAGADADFIQKGNGSMSAIANQLSFWNNTYFTLPVKIEEAGLYKVFVSAWGGPAEDPRGKKWPIMKLSLDSEDICTWEVASQERQLYVSSAMALEPGAYQLKISFINDFSAGKADRNLFCDGVALGNVKSKDAYPVLMFKGKPAASFGKYIEPLAAKQESVGSKAIPGFYAGKRQIREDDSPTRPASQVAVTLAGGLSYRLDQFETVESLNGQWKISGLANSQEPYPEDVDLASGYERRDYNDASWDTIAVPLDWYRKYPGARKEDAPYVKGWYRKGINVSKEQEGKRVCLNFDVIGYDATLFVNGKLAGRHHGDFTPWSVDITPWVEFGAENTLAIRVLSDFGPSFGVTKPAEHAYGSQWSIGNIKGGLWQDVSLSYLPPMLIKRALITPSLAASSIEVDYLIENHTGQKQDLTLYGTVVSAMKTAGDSPAGAELGKVSLLPGANEGRVEIKLKDPQLWSPDNPYLYYLSLALVREKKVVAAHSERFGFREFKTQGKNFFLNGEKIYLFGENLPSVGYGGSGRSEEEEAKSLIANLRGFRELGYNIVRTPHMPIIPLAINLADEIGMMIFDEWAWSFTRSLNEEVFERNNLAEVREWVWRDYNNPSVVMWSCGNEVYYGGIEENYRQLNKQVALVRQLDRSGRPVSSFSGAASGYGTEKLATDVIDLHTYLGLSSPAWSNFEERLESIIATDTGIYGADGKLDKPFIIWECVGFSWGETHDPFFSLNNVDAYAKYVEKQSTWAGPNGIGYAGTIGLAAALDSKLGNKYGRELFGKRIMEFIRYNQDSVQGFAPWFQDSKLNVATVWNQPLFAGLRGANRINVRNVFAGRSYQQELFVVNSQNRSYDNLEVRLSLVDAEGKELSLGSAQVTGLAAWQKITQPVTISFPQQLTPGNYQLRLRVMGKEQELSRNYYDVFVQSSKIVTEPIVTAKKIALLDAAEADQKAAELLTKLGVKYAPVKDLESLAGYEVFIIPPATKQYQLFESSDNRQTLVNWLRAGGSVLQLEQNYHGASPLEQNLLPGENTFVDLVLPEHPVFKGLEPRHFDTWDNQDHGYAIGFSCSPFTTNALAVRGPFLGQNGVGNAIAEGTYGNGRVFTSQVQATALWDQDSAASTYLRNVLTYLLAESKQYADVRPWDVGTKTLRVAAELMVSIDLKPYVNRGFADDVDGDQLGGWTDQGNNDYRIMPLGQQKLGSIPFTIIDPAQNNGKSCIVLGGGSRQYFPRKVEGITVNEYLGRLFFLHTMAWGSANVGEYRIVYEDGSVEKIALQGGLNIADWWTPSDLPGARLALVKENPQNHNVGLWALAWENPRPGTKISSIAFESSGAAVPVLVAISGEKANAKPVVIDDFEKGKNWNKLSNGGKGAVPSLAFCRKANEPENVRQGNVALKVVMPAQSSQGTPVVFCGFPKGGLADGGYNYLTFWLKADNYGKIAVVLPKDDWKDRLSAEVVIKTGQWQKVRLSLKEDMGLGSKSWGFDKLRGEFFIYNQNVNSSTTFYLDDIRFE